MFKKTFHILALLFFGLKIQNSWAFTSIPTDLDKWNKFKSTALSGLYKDSHRLFFTVYLGEGKRTLKTRFLKAEGSNKGLYILIPGTGGVATSSMAGYVAIDLASNGYDVLIVTNPFSTDFQTSFSPDKLIGFPQKDLKPTIEMIKQAWGWYLAKYGRPKNVGLVGYSLGGTYTAMIAASEASIPIPFTKYIVLNPPFDFKHSLTQIDNLLKDSLKNQILSTRAIENLLKPIKLPERGLQDEELQVIEGGTPGKEKDNKKLIGTSFQVTLSRITLGIVPSKDFYINRLVRIAPRMTFNEYTNLIGPALIKKKLLPARTNDELMETNNLINIFQKIPDKSKVYVVSALNDFLLSPTDIDTFSEQIDDDHFFVFSGGGHCGEFSLYSFKKLLQNILAH